MSKRKQQRHTPDSVVKKAGRRKFLVGSAGAALALPFLESVSSPSRAGAWAPEAGKPKRLIVLFHGHGTIMEEFIPQNGFQQGAVMQPVVDAGLTSKMLIVSGINSKTVTGHGGSPTILTCHPGVENQYGNNVPTVPTIDHVIARHMQDGGIARRLDLELHPDSLGDATTRNSRSSNFWSGNDEQVSAIVTPQAAFDAAFPNAGQAPQPMVPGVDLQALRRRSVLGGVLSQFNQLRGRVSMSDRVRLDLHMDRISELEASISTMTPPPVPLPTCTEPMLGSTAGLTHEMAGHLLVDVLAQGMACNQADVGTFFMKDLAENAFGHITHPDMAQTFAGEGFHPAWHRASDMGLDYARRAFTAINAWYASLFARLMTRLDEIDEGDGTALDNTMIVWLSDFGHGGGHGVGNLHLVLAGNAGGPALGRHAALGLDDPARSYADENNPGNHNLAVTMQQAFGIPSDRFGDYQNTFQPVLPGPMAL